MGKPLVVLISGKIGSGKNTLADMILKELGDKALADSFARPLKEFCRDTLRPVTDYLNQNCLTCGPGGDWILDEHWFEKKTPVTRLLLQIVGTDIVRKIDDYYWTRAAARNIGASTRDIILMTDWRFPNEFEKINEVFHTFTIRVNRDLPRSEGFNEHISETALDSRMEYNVVVENNQSLEVLQEWARDIAYLLIEETMV